MITPKQMLLHMEVPNRPNLFVLGCFESRVTVYSQQVRALNLMYSLFVEGRIRPNANVAIVGAGVAGLTAAAAATLCGCNVTILDRLTQPLALLGGHQRWLHPRIYDWPEEGTLDSDAHLPILNWVAGPADSVKECLLKEFQQLRSAYDIKTSFGVHNIALSSGMNRCFSLSWNRERAHVNEFDIVILAVGFGIEKRVDNVPFISYWRNDQLDDEDLTIQGPKHYLVSGTGDGGLVDLLRIRVGGFRHDQVIARLTTNWLDQGTLARVTTQLLEIESIANTSAAAGKDYVSWLNEEYTALAETLRLRDLLLLRRDTKAALTSLHQFPLTLKASILNRFLFSLLPDVKYYQGPWVAAPDDDGFALTFHHSSEIYKFDQIVVRHGPVPALKVTFPDVWEQCQPLRARNELDQTRFPIYGNFFLGIEKTSETVKSRPVALQIPDIPSRLNRDVSIDLNLKPRKVRTPLLKKIDMFREGYALSAVAFSFDASWLATLNDGGEVSVRDMRRGMIGKRLVQDSVVSSIALGDTTERSVLVTGAVDGIARFWDIETLSGAETTYDHGVQITAVAVAPVFSLVATAGSDGIIKVWDDGNEKPIKTLSEPGTNPKDLRLVFSYDRLRLATVGWDNLLVVWDTSLWHRQCEIHVDPYHSGTCLAFAHNNRTIATGDRDGRVRIWNTLTGAREAEVDWHSAAVESIAFSYDDKVLAAGFRDGVIKVWTGPLWNESQLFPAHDAAVNSLAFSPVSLVLVAVSEDCTATIWTY